MKSAKILMVLGAFAVLFVLGCKSGPSDTIGAGKGITGNPDEPAWVSRGSGEFPGDVGKALYAVGMCSYDPNLRVQVQVAQNTARQEMGRQIETYVANLIKDFMQSHRDYADPSTASSIQFFQSVSKSVSEATLNGSKQIDSWRDPQDKTMFVLYTMPLGNVMSEAKGTVMKKAREQQAELFKAKADEALKALDAELEKRRDAVEGK